MAVEKADEGEGNTGYREVIPVNPTAPLRRLADHWDRTTVMAGIRRQPSGARRAHRLAR
jgi:hypothetical protein